MFLRRTRKDRGLRRATWGRRDGRHTARLLRNNPLRLESLEPRLLLSNEPVVISEFLASNHHGLVDDYGQESDWIELFNPSGGTVDLTGWYLTNRADNPTKWQFPSGSIAPGGYLVVFASGQDGIGPGGKLHTSFNIKASGEYLGLYRPDRSKAYEFYPEFPQQYEDVSYGVTQDVATLVHEGDPVHYLVPAQQDAGAQWTAEAYNDSSWGSTLAATKPGLAITEIDAGTTNWLEIQNVAGRDVHAAGWFVAVNNSAGGINAANSRVWSLPTTVTSGQVLYRTEDAADPSHYWGDNINWEQSRGWVMIVDGLGRVVDFLPWGYSAAQIASLSVSVNGFTNITVGSDQWSGSGATLSSGTSTTMFNDHVRGGATSNNATAYGAQPGATASGLLKNIDNGANTGITLSTTASAGVTYGGNVGSNPSAGTDAYSIFNGYVDFSGGSYTTIEVDGTDTYTHDFTGLDTGTQITYNFTGTMIRGGGYADRWTLVTLVGAVASTPAHSTGNGIVVISPTQVALWTGENDLAGQGFVVRWNGIDPGTDGEFSVVSSQYTGATPGVGAGTASGTKGYALGGIKLDEIVPGGAAHLWLARTGNSDNNTAADFGLPGTQTKGAQNSGLTIPFAGYDNTASTLGIGYNTKPSGFDVTYYKAKIQVNDLATAESVIGDPGLQTSTANEKVSAINYFNSGSDGNYAPSRAVPTAVGDTDDYVMLMTGTVLIPAAGTWTFGVSSDDGFSVELTKGTQRFYFDYPSPRAPADTLSTFNVTDPGAYTMRMVFFERGGGSEVELFAASGTYATFDPAAFDLVGDTANGGLAVTGYGGLIHTDVGPIMSHANASIWTRIPFQVNSLADLDSMTLRMMYNDGFVAYLNGQPIASRNAPANPTWNSQATAQRSMEDSAAYENIPVGQYLGLLHVGTNVLAIRGLNFNKDDGDVLLLPELTVTSSQQVLRYFATPTPEKPNVPGFLDFVKDTKFSVDRGFYDAPFQLTITTKTDGATIRYTLDGSTPTETNGTVYTGPLTISSTTVVRAAAFKVGYQPANVDTETYIFLNDVIQQSPLGQAPPGWPSGSVNGQTLNYGMDPNIVNNATWGPQLRSALMSIPTMSLVTDVPNLFDASTGIYVNAYQDGPSWERPASLELINPDGSKGFQINAGLRIRGGYSRQGSNPKHAFRVIFNSDYGGPLQYALFGNEGVDVFHNVDLRCSQNYSWSFEGNPANAEIREVFSRDTQKAMGEPYTRSRFYHLYIDGQYWGLFQTEERPEADFAASYLGGTSADYDVIKVNDGYNIYATDGDMNAWTTLWNMAMAGFASDAAYYHAQGLDPVTHQRDPAYPVYLDVDNLIDYMIVILYTGDMDAPISNFLGNTAPNNWYGFRNRDGESGFQFVSHDAEHTLSRANAIAGGNANRNGPWPAGWNNLSTSSPQMIHQELMANADYRMQFADRAFKYLTHNGLLTGQLATDPARVRFMDRANELGYSITNGGAMVAESARWGNTSLTKNTWLNQISTETGSFFPGRANILINQLKSTVLGSWRGSTAAPLYPSTAAPEFNQWGGQVTPNFALTMTSASGGTIYYTLDGTDPRLPGGAVNPSPSVRIYTAGSPVMLTVSTLVHARVLQSGVWSPLSDVWFYIGQPAAHGNVAITELNYNPYVPTPAELDRNPNLTASDFEFIELRNTTSQMVDLTGVRFTSGVTFDFTAGSVRSLSPGQYVLVAANPAALAIRYGAGLPIAGLYVGVLADGGEQITLSDRFGRVIHDFEYADSGRWPNRADGRGSSIEALNTGGNYGDSDNWRASSEYGGSPGRAGTGPTADVVVNEILSWSVPAGGNAIELYNPAFDPIDVSGWYLSDTSSAYKKFRIPDGTVIGAYGYRVFDEQDFNRSGGADPLHDIVLGGDQPNDVWLMQADAGGQLIRFADHAEIGPALAGVSFGRSPNGTGDFVLMQGLTLGTYNARPRAGAIVINELNVNPDVKTESVEYIELYNYSNQTVNLSGWQLTEGVLFTFPNGTSLLSHQYLVIAQDPAAVQAKFGVSSLGPYSGKLANEGEKLTLRDQYGILQDQVTYGYGFPWPTVGDAPGYTMELIHPSLDNDLGGNWRASAATPGQQSTPVEMQSQWRYFKGTAEPLSNWKLTTFSDAGWLLGTAPLGYNEPPVNTALGDMSGGYSTLYLRKTFNVTDPAQISSLLLELLYDDGVNVWINGKYVAGANVSGSSLPYTATAQSPIEPVGYIPFTLTNPSSYLLPGTNVLAVQLLNASKIDAEGAVIDARLTATSTAAPGGTPGAQNSVYAANDAPQMRQVDHTPVEPAAGQDVTVTVKVTDPNDVATVSLAYQLVNPGDYIAIDDPRYQTQWTSVPMYDDGAHGDLYAGDSVYAAVLPGTLQTNRRLVRYRITATDSLGASITAPYADDPQPNFAYYVYNGVPAWTGAAQPGATQPVTYSSDLLDNLPVYQLITSRESHVDSQHLPGALPDAATDPNYYYWGNDYPWYGTLVYEGVVYDHVTFRAEGDMTRYSMGKNAWQINFLRGHELQAKDAYGQDYPTQWNTLNLAANIQPADYQHRGEQGLFEAVGSRLYNLAGVASAETNQAQLRVVDGASETGADQYSGDFQGMYLVVEQLDGKFLDEHGLTDGNLYEMAGGTGTLTNQGPTQPSDNSDLANFMTAYGQTQTDAWWRDNFNLESYYDFRAITEAVHNWDVGFGTNYYYYHDPDTGQWSILPGNLDLTWSTAYNPSGGDNEPMKSRVLSRSVFAQEYRNRMREIRDLLWNSEQTGMLIDEFAAQQYTAGSPSWVDADRAMWDYNPIMLAKTTGYQSDGDFTIGSGGAQAASWTFSGLSAGQYEVSLTYANRTDWSTGAPFSVYDGAALRGVVAVNQRLAPSGLSDDGVNWKILGTYNVSSGTLAVRLTDAVGGPVVADGVRIRNVTDGTVLRIDNGDAGYSIETGTWKAVPGYVDPAKAGQGKFYQLPATHNFAGMVQQMKDWITTRAAYIDSSILGTEESQVPARPTVTFVGQPGFAIDGLSFQTTAFSSPTGATFAAMEWRVAKVTDPARPNYDPSEPRDYEITSTWESGELTAFSNRITIPGDQLQFGDTYRVRVRMKDSAGRWGHWSSPVQFSPGGTTGPLTSDLRITEINYHPAAPPAGSPYTAEDFEFIELTNVGHVPLALYGVQFTQGIDFTFGNATLQPGRQILLVANQPAFESRYGTGLNIAGSYIPDQLQNAGERIRLEDPYGQTILDFTYSVDGDWPGRPDGKGSTLEVVDPAGLYSSAGNWRASYQFNGSPGTANPAPAADVVINEVLTHTDPPLRDSVELHNTTSSAIDVSGWYISDTSANYKKFRIPDGTVIAAGGYLVFDERDFNPNPLNPGPNDFTFDGAHGDDVWLLKADAQGNLVAFADHVEFGAARNGESFGRWQDDQGDWHLVPMIARSLGGPNDLGGVSASPRVGPLIISELMYHPSNPGGGIDEREMEYVEVYNPTLDAVSLNHWRLAGGISFDLPNIALGAHQALVVVPFNTGNTTLLDAFYAHYNIDLSTTIVGGYEADGYLSDTGELVQLLRPDDPPLGEPNYWPGMVEDEVDYADSGLWPSGPDGTGDSLDRQGVVLWGDDAASWAAASPTPGTVALAAAVAQRYVFYNNSALDGYGPGISAADDAAIAKDKAALRGAGSVATFANYTNYTGGLNGIMIDLQNAPGRPTLAIYSQFFQFNAGNNGSPAGWAAAPTPLNVITRPGAGVGGSDCVTILWADGAIQEQWLKVTVKANASAGLATPDVFYFGNAVGETGNAAGSAEVDALDENAVRTHRTGFAPAAADNRYDVNRDGRVNAADELLVRHNHAAGAGALQLFTVPTGGAFAVLSGSAADTVGTAGGPDSSAIGAAQPQEASGLRSNTVWRPASQTTFAALLQPEGPRPAVASHVLLASAGQPAWFAPAAVACDAALRSLDTGTSGGESKLRAAYAWLDELAGLQQRQPSAKPKSLPAALQDAALAAYLA